MGSEPKKELTLERLSNLPWTKRRGVAFIKGHEDFIEEEAFQTEYPNNSGPGKKIKYAMDVWHSIPDIASKDGLFHGWDKNEHDGANEYSFVFTDRNGGIRFYGFLCNPDKENPRFQLFVAVEIRQKRGYDTEPRILHKLAEIRKDSNVLKCIKGYFETMNGGNK